MIRHQSSAFVAVLSYSVRKDCYNKDIGRNDSQESQRIRRNDKMAVRMLPKTMVGATLPGNSTVEMKEFEIPKPGPGED